MYEVVEVTPKLRRMIHARAGSQSLREQAERDGSMSLRQAGVELALAGRTSLEEILRVTRTDDIELDLAAEAGTDAAREAA